MPEKSYKSIPPGNMTFAMNPGDMVIFVPENGTPEITCCEAPQEEAAAAAGAATYLNPNMVTEFIQS